MIKQTKGNIGLLSVTQAYDKTSQDAYLSQHLIQGSLIRYTNNLIDFINGFKDTWKNCMSSLIAAAIAPRGWQKTFKNISNSLHGYVKHITITG